MNTRLSHSLIGGFFILIMSGLFSSVLAKDYQVKYRLEGVRSLEEAKSIAATIATLTGSDRKAFLAMDDSHRRTFLAMSDSDRRAILAMGDSNRKKLMEVMAREVGTQSVLQVTPSSKPSEWVKLFTPSVPKSGGAFKVAGTIAGEMMKKYLALADADFPPIIPLPQLPPALNLKQDEYELDDEFEERVKEETEKRRKEIEALQATYREKVEARNGHIGLLQLVGKQRREKADMARRVFVRDAILIGWKGFSLSKPELDKKNGDVYLRLTSRQHNFQERVTMNTRKTRKLRKALFTNLPKVAQGVAFDLGEDGTLSLSKVTVKFGGEEAEGELADPDKKISSGEMVAVIDSSGGNQEFSELQKLQKQNPNLKGDFQTGTIIWKDGRTAKVSYKDDIPALLKKMRGHPVDKSRWLLVIGAEKYRSTDDILYAERSAKLFTEAAVRALGVRKGNVVALYNEQATGGGIKHETRRLLENVREGDTIYFYYNGHGVPVPAKDNDPYLLPTDMIPDYIDEDPYFSLRNFYKMLTDSKADKVFAFVDSCFTGQTDNKSVYKGTKGATRLAPKKVSFDQSKMALITAGTDKQFSNAYEKRGHRLFTYFLIKSLLNNRADIRNLYKEVSVAVSDESREKGSGYKQDPVFAGNENLKLR